MSETSVQQPSTNGAVEPVAAQAPARPRSRRNIDPVAVALVPVIIIAGVIGAVVNPAFLTKTNIVDNIITTSAVLGVVVIAESVILIGGYFDLSLQSTVGFAPMLMAVLVSPAADGGRAWPLAAGFVVMILAVLVIGLANGLMIARMKPPAFIVTLAMLTLLAGLTIGLSGGQTFSDLPRAMTYLGDGLFLTLPIQAWILVLGFAGVYVFMRYTPTGRSIYAMGGNADAAKAAGVRTTRLTIGIIVFGSLLAMVAGLMLTGRINSVTANQGDGLIFTVFAAAVIGGINLNGGRGNLVGAFLGVMLLGIIQNILTLSNVPSFWIQAAYGAIILAALLIGWLSGNLGPKRKAA
ncbi:sugar ABC transporter permease [Angustibacter aerolatus]|uniref:Autoinducer 2 import system permease protein LsrC n=1 Tax=Angustibacter aerolatus TaxID=1162965 RepID=A0ABQ6JJD2_9ACTN|nr:ABC transporter permease [Angustibacter aerolatus]GMA88362.1 sugar ABC transporter permease [Angustibacter aerolatus]